MSLLTKVPLSCRIVNGGVTKGTVDVTNVVLFALDDHIESVIFEVSLMRGILNKHMGFLFTHHHSEKGPGVEFQDAFREVAVPFAGWTREVTIFCPGLFRAPKYLY